MYCHKTGGTGGDRTYQAQLQGRKVHCSVEVGGGGRRRTLCIGEQGHSLEEERCAEGRLGGEPEWQELWQFVNEPSWLLNRILFYPTFSAKLIQEY